MLSRPPAAFARRTSSRATSNGDPPCASALSICASASIRVRPSVQSRISRGVPRSMRSRSALTSGAPESAGIPPKHRGEPQSGIVPFVGQVRLVLHDSLAGLFRSGFVGVQPADRGQHVAGPRLFDMP